MANNGTHKDSGYFRITWWAWKALGAVALIDRDYRSYEFWRSIVLNSMATVFYPITLILLSQSFEDPLDNLLNFNISMTSVATVIKFLMYTSQLKKIGEIEQVLVELDKRVDTEEQKSIHTSMCKELRFISNMFIGSYTLTTFTTEGTFLFEEERTLPFPIWFPLDWHESMFNYLLAIVYSVVSVTAELLQNFADDLFPPLLLCLIARNCELLIQRISVIGYDQKDLRANEQRLYSCIHDQHQIYRLLDLAMDIISGPLLVQFIVIAIDVGAALCGLVFYVESQHDFLFYYYLSFIFGLFLQIFPICYYGTVVEYMFESLHYAVFTSNWVDQSVAYRRTAVIFAYRTEKVPKLLAGGVIPISLVTFLGNCKAAYSFFTLIADTQ